MNRQELAITLHSQGFNCAQCVACSFCDVLGYDPITAFKMSEAFGFGMGTANTCGALSGMAMVIGMKNSDGDLDHPMTKKESYNLMSIATDEFKRQCKSTICREIKGMDGGPVLCSCNDCIINAVTILDDMLLGIKADEAE